MNPSSYFQQFYKHITSSSSVRVVFVLLGQKVALFTWFTSFTA